MYKYKLHNGKRKQICPNCQKRRFVRYLDVETNEFLPKHIGRCDREIKCSYHYKPKDFFEDTNTSVSFKINKKTAIPKPISYLKNDLVKNTNKQYENNYFVDFLKTIFFTYTEIFEILNKYKIGTSKKWQGATIFWQIDNFNRVRSGKVMLYHKETGKRTKYFTWIHAILLKNKTITNFNLKQCLFGLHLIKTEDKPIAIVESEKTACIMSELFKKYTWLAVGSKGNLNEVILAPIKHKKIILYPDLGISKKGISPYQEWDDKRIAFNKKGFDISISNLLEKKATSDQIENGFDIADYFIEQQKINSVEKDKKELQMILDKYDLLTENVNFFHHLDN